MRDANPTITTILAHRSVREFTDEPLSNGTIDILREAMQRGPSSSALQTYTVILVDDPEQRKRLQPHAGGQDFLAQCPLFIVGCADLRRVRNVTDERDYTYRASDLRILLSATEDLTIAMQNGSLAAQSLGLGTVMVGGVLNGSREIHQLLHLPQRVVPLLGLCVGHPVSDPRDWEARPRLPSRVTFHRNRFSLSDEEERLLLKQHDRQVMERGYYDGRRIPYEAIQNDELADPVADASYGWTEHVARKQSRLWWETAGPKVHADFAAMGLELTAKSVVGSDTSSITKPLKEGKDF